MLGSIYQNKVLSQSVSSDKAWMDAVYRGESKAWEQVYEKISGYLFAACLRYAENREEAEDFLQEGFYLAYSKIHTFQGNSSLQTWITRVVINHSINQIRKKKQFKTTDVTDIAEDISDDEIPDMDANVELDLVMACMQKLPVGYRTVLNMYAIDKMSHQEIADSLGINISTSKSQLFKARKMLVKLVEEMKNGK